MPIINTIIAGGGSSPVIDPLNVTPSTSAQTITASGGVDGYSPVNVSAVTSSIDANITAGNIKKDVTILGVTGSYEGTTPTGTKSITANGVYDVTDFASADVQVPTTAPAHYVEKTVDANGVLVSTANIMDFSGVSSIGAYQLYNAYRDNTLISGVVDMRDITSLPNEYSLSEAFRGCTGITGVNLSSLEKISGATATTGSGAFYYTFSGCTNLTSVDLSSLKIIDRTLTFSNQATGAFSGCTNLTNVYLQSLVTISTTTVDLFRSTGLTSFIFYSLKNLGWSHTLWRCFFGCQGLTSLSFPAITSGSFGSRVDQFESMCGGLTNVVIHFPSNVQTQVEALTGYSATAPFSATSGSVLFDLPKTVILTGANSQAYERSPKDDTATALAWRKKDTGTATSPIIDWTPFYTSGTTDPAVNDTIYSDSACTTAVTTISSIA